MNDGDIDTVLRTAARDWQPAPTPDLREFLPSGRRRIMPVRMLAIAASVVLIAGLAVALSLRGSGTPAHRPSGGATNLCAAPLAQGSLTRTDVENACQVARSTARLSAATRTPTVEGWPPSLTSVTAVVRNTSSAGQEHGTGVTRCHSATVLYVRLVGSFNFEVAPTPSRSVTATAVNTILDRATGRECATGGPLTSKDTSLPGGTILYQAPTTVVALATLTVNVGTYGGPAGPNGHMALSDAPVSAARVSARGDTGRTTTATTGSNGDAELSLAPGRYTVTSSKCGSRAQHVMATSGHTTHIHFDCDVP